MAVPITKPKGPSEFVGDDDDFLRQVHQGFDRLGLSHQFSDQTLVTYGREFCSVLSGGGMLASKVDFWAGFYRLDNPGSGALFLAAMDVYCPELAEGYVRIRTGSRTAEPTVQDRADLARFAATFHQPRSVQPITRMSVTDMERAAAVACDVSFKPGWVNTRTITKLTRHIPELGRIQYVLALLLAFCPDVGDEAKAALSLPGGT